MKPSKLTLMYHNVTRPTDAFDGIGASVTKYFVVETQFEQHLEAIAKTREANDEVTSAYIEVTFDDGWAGSFDVAGPILERFGMTATVFVTTGLVGQPHFASADVLRDAVNSGTFRIGSHGVTHRLLATLPINEVRHELVTSKRQLEGILGLPVTSLAFPGGSYNGQIERLARDIGYTEIYTSKVGLNTSRGTTVNRSAVMDATTTEQVVAWMRGDFGRAMVKQRILDAAKSVLGRRVYTRLRDVALGSADDLDMTDLLSPSVGLPVAVPQSSRANQEHAQTTAGV